MFGIEYTMGEEAFYDNAKDIVIGLMSAETPVASQIMVAMIVVELAEFVEKNYTYNGTS